MLKNWRGSFINIGMLKTDGVDWSALKILKKWRSSFVISDILRNWRCSFFNIGMRNNWRCSIISNDICGVQPIKHLIFCGNYTNQAIFTVISKYYLLETRDIFLLTPWILQMKMYLLASLKKLCLIKNSFKHVFRHFKIVQIRKRKELLNHNVQYQDLCISILYSLMLSRQLWWGRLLVHKGWLFPSQIYIMGKQLRFKGWPL